MTFSPSFGRIFSPSFKPNSLADAVVAGGWWLTGGISAANCIAAYQPKGAADLAGSYVNLANPGTYNLTLGTAPTWDVTNGWIFTNAGATYLKTGVIPENDKTWSMIFKFSNYTAGGNWATPCGMWSASGQGFAITTGAGTKYGFYNGGYQGGENSVTNGVLAVAGNQGYYNGVDKTADIGTGAAAFEDDIYIGGPNNIGTFYQAVNIYIQAIAIYDVALSATQVGTLTTAMNAL